MFSESESLHLYKEISDAAAKPALPELADLPECPDGHWICLGYDVNDSQYCLTVSKDKMKSCGCGFPSKDAINYDLVFVLFIANIASLYSKIK